MRQPARPPAPESLPTVSLSPTPLPFCPIESRPPQRPRLSQGGTRARGRRCACRGACRCACRSDRRDEGEGLAAHGLGKQRHPATHLGERAQLERRLGQPAAAARLLRLELRCEHLVEVGLRVRVGV